MSCVVSTTNSNYKTKEDGTVLGLLGYSDSANYYPFQDLESLDGKNDFTKGDYTKTSDGVPYLTSPQIVGLSPNVHRLYVSKLGTWSMDNAGQNYPHMWEDLGYKKMLFLRARETRILSFHIKVLLKYFNV